MVAPTKAQVTWAKGQMQKHAKALGYSVEELSKTDIHSTRQMKSLRVKWRTELYVLLWRNGFAKAELMRLFGTTNTREIGAVIRAWEAEQRGRGE